jgi:hypothetical protein
VLFKEIITTHNEEMGGREHFLSFLAWGVGVLLINPGNGFLDRRTGLTRAVSESGEPHKTINGIHFNSFTLCVLCG